MLPCVLFFDAGSFPTRGLLGPKVLAAVGPVREGLGEPDPLSEATTWTVISRMRWRP